MSQQPRPQYNQSVYASYQPESSAFTAQFLAMSPVYQLHEQPTTAIPVNVPPPNLGPDASFVTPKVASLTVQRFLSSELSKEGFLSAEAPALHRLELEVLAFVERLYGNAKEYAELSSRAGPSPVDLLSACEEYNMHVPDLCRESRRKSRKRKRVVHAPLLVLPSPRSSSPELLPSDDEGAPLVVPQTLRSLPSHLPTLPPKHTYLRTPAPPPKKQALPSLEKKLENAALVQDSLRNLLLSTEDSPDQEDGELLGGVVNWETTRQPRKKWKIRG